MKPTRWWMLIGYAVVAGLVAYFLTAAFYNDVQSPPQLAPLWLLLLALAEAYVASMTRHRLAGRHGTKPIDPIAVARLAALAKASSAVGALAAGAWTGFLVHVARAQSPQAGTDTRTAALGLGCSIGLVAAALLLEWVCRVKRPPDDQKAPPR